MVKISGIIPASSRVTTVDLSASKPVRPGAPSFGGPKASAISPNDFFGKPATTWKTRDLEKADIVGKLSDSFFSNKIEKVAEKVIDVEQRVANDNFTDTVSGYEDLYNNRAITLASQNRPEVNSYDESIYQPNFSSQVAPQESLQQQALAQQTAPRQVVAQNVVPQNVAPQSIVPQQAESYSPYAEPTDNQEEQYAPLDVYG